MLDCAKATRSITFLLMPGKPCADELSRKGMPPSKPVVAHAGDRTGQKAGLLGAFKKRCLPASLESTEDSEQDRWREF